MAFVAALAVEVPPGCSLASPVAMPTPRDIVILFQDPPNVPGIVALNDGLRRVLQGQPGLNVYTEHLDLSRFAGGEFEAGLRDWLRSKYAKVRLDLVVAAGAGAVAFAIQPERIWPDVPVVFCGVDERLAGPFRALAGVTGIELHYPIRETMELALGLFPSARTLAIVGGASGPDRAWWDLLRREAAPFRERVEVVEVLGLPMADTLERLRAMPRGSPVVGMTFLRDGAGRPWTGPEVVRALEPAAPGPVFSTWDFLVGKGAAGGVVVNHERHGEEAGALALRVLGGEPASSIPTQVSNASGVLLDWRVLARWGVAEALVPPGAEVRFRALPPWREYPRTATAVLVALLVQAALIAVLLVERRRRRLAEVAASDSRTVVAHLNRVGTVGELAGSLAHEINTPLASIQNSARAVRRLLAARQADGEDDLAVNLDIIESEGTRAGEIIRRMRAVLRKGPSRTEGVDAREIAGDAAAMVRPQARQRGVELIESLPRQPLQLEGDRVQLLQVVLNLLLNAVEAVAPLDPQRRRIELGVEAVGETVRIRVKDSGAGFSRTAREHLFEPFFTTKEAGLGMGLSISRTIVEAHGGRMWIGDEPGGALVNVDLPAHGRPGVAAREEAR